MLIAVVVAFNMIKLRKLAQKFEPGVFRIQVTIVMGYGFINLHCHYRVGHTSIWTSNLQFYYSHIPIQSDFTCFKEKSLSYWHNIISDGKWRFHSSVGLCCFFPLLVLTRQICDISLEMTFFSHKIFIAQRYQWNSLSFTELNMNISVLASIGRRFLLNRINILTWTEEISKTYLSIPPLKPNSC
jgi:hypothetical protein